MCVGMGGSIYAEEVKELLEIVSEHEGIAFVLSTPGRLRIVTDKLNKTLREKNIVGMDNSVPVHWKPKDVKKYLEEKREQVLAIL